MRQTPLLDPTAAAAAAAALAAAAVATLVAIAMTGCDGGAAAHPSLALTADQASAPADGLTQVALDAAVKGAPDGAVVRFDVDGVGLLSATNVAAHKGHARTSLYAPFESELGSVATATITAKLVVDGKTIAKTTVVSFTVPTAGAPVLTAHADPDRVVAGGPDPITIVVDARRLADPAVTISADSDAVALPSSLTLDAVADGFHGELVVAPPSAPVDVTVTIGAAGAAPVDVVLHFIPPDAPAFDLSGTFAEVEYGVVKIGDLVFLDPDPQCVIAPSLVLVRITQDGAHLALDETTCDVQMPSVNVILVGRSETTVGPGFVDATNARRPGAIEFDLGAVGAGAPFDPPESAFATPLVVGAELASPADDLPTTVDDPRVTDDDNDGQPGVTVMNTNEGAQYIVFRTQVHTMTGTIESSDVVRGTGTSDTETNILNGGGISPTVTSEPSPFFLQRVDGRNGAPDIAARDGDSTSISCADLIAYASELETTAPPPDTSTACP